MSLFKFNKRQKEQEDLQNRAKQFMQEYKVIRARYRCDFQSFLKMIENGEAGIVPALRIVDITKTIKKEEEAEMKKREAEMSIEKVKESEPSKNGE